MADTTVQLGDFTFTSFEVPEVIPFGGEQELAIHKLPGGAKVVDAMGWFPKALKWGGRFQGENAKARALYVQGLFQIGQALTLTWDSFRYQVVPRIFDCDFERFYQLPYTLELEVVQDLTSPVTTAPTVTIDDQVASDMASATASATAVGDTTLTGNLTSVQTAISAVPTFEGATQAQLTSVLGPIATAQTYVASLVASNTATANAGGTFCGMEGGAAPAALAASLTGYQTAMTTLANLQDVSNYLERIAVNLEADGASGPTLTTAGGNLYAVAASAYGDPSEWTTLAEANGLTDPVLTGLNQIRVPAQPDGDGGIWQN
jgi:hypothetical protein